MANKDTALEILNDIKNLLTDMKSKSGIRSEISYLIQDEAEYLKDVSQREATSSKKEIATLASGTKVSWSDHLGSWSGTVLEVHHAKVRRVVRNIRMLNDGVGYEHEITRIGTYKDPALVIAIEGGDGGIALKLMSQINIDELVTP